MNKFLIIAGIYGLIGVSLGAFGAHGLEERLVDNGRLDTWETATLYLFVHMLALLWISGNARVESELGLATLLAWFWTAGVAIFSGSLYVLALTNWSMLGAITPLGGLCFLVGWSLLIVLGFRRKDSSFAKS